MAAGTPLDWPIDHKENVYYAPRIPLIRKWGLSLYTQGLGNIALDPPGQDYGTSVVGDFIEGTVVTITITPNTDYEFVRIEWEGGGQTTDNPSQVTMDADKTGLVVIEPK